MIQACLTNPQNHPTNIHQNLANTNFITSIWHKKHQSQHTSKPSNISQSTSLTNYPKQNSIDQQNDKIIISKKQLQQFTKKFAINQIDYQQKQQQLKNQLKDKNNRIQTLAQQIDDLRTQQDYLMKVMEQLRDRHINQLLALNNKNQVNIKLKQNQIDYLKEEIVKIRAWLEEEKCQAKRCFQFLKIKDQIIQNLEWEVVKLRNQVKFIKDKETSKREANYSYQGEIKSYLSSTLKFGQNKIDEFKRQRTNSTKKIIIRKQNKQNKQQKSTKQASMCQKNQDNQNLIHNSNLHTLQLQKLQLQNQKFEIFAKYREVCLQNETFKKAIQNLQKQKEELKKLNQHNKITKSIKQLDQISQRIKQSQADKQNLLITKCNFLQKHIEKLTKELNRTKSSQVLLQFSKDTEQIQQLDGQSVEEQRFP